MNESTIAFDTIVKTAKRFETNRIGSAWHEALIGCVRQCATTRFELPSLQRHLSRVDQPSSSSSAVAASTVGVEPTSLDADAERDDATMRHLALIAAAFARSTREVFDF
jgi:hypothetical protein